MTETNNEAGMPEEPGIVGDPSLGVPGEVESLEADPLPDENNDHEDLGDTDEPSDDDDPEDVDPDVEDDDGTDEEVEETDGGSTDA